MFLASTLLELSSKPVLLLSFGDFLLPSEEFLLFFPFSFLLLIKSILNLLSSLYELDNQRYHHRRSQPFAASA
jgi:hypothetical protein